MKIKNVKIENWRSIKQTEIDFQDIMLFIGQNNCGKSNILYALLWFFGQINNSKLDFNESDKDLYTEITFNDLDEFDKNQFQKYLTVDGTIKVRKTGFFEGGFSYNGYVEMPEEDWLKEDKINEYTQRSIAEKLPLAQYLPNTGRITIAMFKEAQNEFIEQNKGSITLHYEIETTPFLGAKNVAIGIFGDIFFIPAVKSAVDEFNLRGNTAFNQLYSEVIRQMADSNEFYKQAKSKMVELSKILNKLDESGTENIRRPVEITSLEEKIKKELESWNTTIDIEITPPNVDDIFKLGANVWIDDGIRTDVIRKGHGLQRALIFALIKSWSTILKEKRLQEENITSTETQQGTQTRRSSYSTYFIFEEPELYLHPQAQKELFSSLAELSKSNNQIILTTHSSSFVDLEYYKSICIVKKDNIEDGTYILQYTGVLFPEANADKVFKMTYWINPDRGELFFAKKVILVEGQTDKTVIPFLSDKIGKFRFDYTIIECGSKDSIPNYLNLLNNFGIEYTVVYDKDHQSYKDQPAITSADLSSERIESLIDRNLGKSVILENDIEEEIGLYDRNHKHKPYLALKTVEDDGFVMANSLKTKIENIYT